MIFISFDPGIKGWMFAMDENRKEIASNPMPLDDRGKVDGGKIFDWLYEVLETVDKFDIEDPDLDLSEEQIDYYIVVENVHSDPKFGTVGNFTFGRSFEAIITALKCLDLDFEPVDPRTWQKLAWGGQKALKDEKGKNDTKATSMLRAMDIFPETDLRKSKRCKLAHDGKVDAMLMAEYARLNYLKNK